MSTHRFPILGALVVLVVTIAARAQQTVARSPARPDLLVSVSTGKVTAPDSIESGWTRVRVEEDGGGHILVVFRFPERATDADVKTFVAALDTARGTPRPAVALGGPEVGDTGEVVIELTAGRYVLGCVRRGTNGHRHTSDGEVKTMRVTKTRRAAVPPRATQNIQMVDFAYVGTERWSAGSHMLRVENRGRQDHQLRLVRLRAGSTLKDWMSAPNPGVHGAAIAGIARIGSGQVAYLPVDLTRGAYVLHCLVPDTASGRPHVELGMLRAIQVE